MILLDAGERTAAAFQAKVLFAAEIEAMGHAALIDERTLSHPLSRTERYEAARYLTDATRLPVDRMILIGAQHLSDETMALCRTYRFPTSVAVTAFGQFPDTQAELHARAKLAYAFGREAEVINLTERARAPLRPDSALPQLVTPCPARIRSAAPTRVTLFIAEAAAILPQVRHGIEILAAHAEMSVMVVLLPGAERGGELAFAGATTLWLDEAMPRAIAAGTDIAALLDGAEMTDRLAQTLLVMMVSGIATIDCTADQLLVGTGAPAARGPSAPEALARHITGTIHANRAGIAGFLAQSAWLRRARLDPAILRPAPLAPVTPGQAAPTDRPPDAAPRLLFLPTNGVGLGHAKRLSLIASALPEGTDLHFAAFPSCIDLLADAGHAASPLVPKSDDHPEPFANDIVNCRRLTGLTRPGDLLVFDGGYIFDSVQRTILEHDLDAIWIRRGLWQATQSNARTLARGRLFRSVIIPEEAFEELNAPPVWGDGARPVGPVVDLSPAPRGQSGATLRRKLADLARRPFERLAVTMLGGGVAADRNAHIHAICHEIARHPDVLNLVVVWPGAWIDPRHFHWPNSRVVQTRQALTLAREADLAISAAGYNSFHEALYHRIPTIFVPQMAPYMDDQERRARAASERGLAETVLAHEFLRLAREIRAFLDGGKAGAVRARLGAEMLPEPGTAAAAAIIAARGAQ